MTCWGLHKMSANLCLLAHRNTGFVVVPTRIRGAAHCSVSRIRSKALPNIRYPVTSGVISKLREAWIHRDWNTQRRTLTSVITVGHLSLIGSLRRALLQEEGMWRSHIQQSPWRVRYHGGRYDAVQSYLFGVAGTNNAQLLKQRPRKSSVCSGKFTRLRSWKQYRRKNKYLPLPFITISNSAT
jgi:hypothetical protein